MHPIAILLGLVLLAFSVFFVVHPFRLTKRQKKSGGRSVLESASVKVSPEQRRQAVLLAIRDLDFDHQAGKIAEDDYQELRQSLLLEAAHLVQSNERQKEDEIEALIHSRRQAVSKGKAGDSVKAQCQHCHSVLLAGAKYCSKCGTPAEESACPKCKQSLRPEDRFCPSCGVAKNLEASSSVVQTKGA